LHEVVPFQSVDEILERKRSRVLFRCLLEKFASFSGISGVQPRILVRDEEAFSEMEQTGHWLWQSCTGATHIVKLWEPNEYPQLAANEHFCLTVARKCKLDVPPYRLAEEGRALVIDRFDLRCHFGVLQIAKDSLRIPERHGAGFADNNAFAHSEEQRTSQLLFKLPDVLAHGGL
jgi:serine/threonine protein kinase HipA of HipAB toxin-antitoxin module